MAVSVPNTETFSLQDVYNSVNSHASPSQDLLDCFAKAEAAYFDPTYNQVSYAPANSMLRFRNYTPSTNPMILDGCVFCLELNETSGSVAYDASGQNNGVYENDTNQVTLGVSGLMNKAADVTGDDDGIYVPAMNRNTYTVSAWVNGAGRTDTFYDFLWDLGMDGLSIRWAGVPFTTSVSRIYYMHASTYYDTGDTMSSGWNHLVVTRNPSGAKVYLNGQLIYTRTASLLSIGTSHFYSGGWGKRNFVGKHDQMCMWHDRELTLAEIQFLYNSGNGLPYSSWS